MRSGSRPPGLQRGHHIAGSLPPLTIGISGEALEVVAERAAELVMERFGQARVCESPFLSAAEAADYLRAKSRQRVYDLPV
jgi:hypothetical protein